MKIENVQKSETQISKEYPSAAVFTTGGKPSTWFPPEGLVEQKLKTVFERNTIDEGKMRHKNKDAKENKRRTRDTTKADERARQVQEQTQPKGENTNKMTKDENKREPNNAHKEKNESKRTAETRTNR